MAGKQRKSLSEVTARVKPNTATVRLSLRGDLAEEHERLGRELEALRGGEEGMSPDPAATELAQRIVDLEAQMRDDEVAFTFEAVGQKAWNDLLAAHPPTKDQRSAGLDHNPETFAPAAIAASLVDPDPGEDAVAEVEALADRLSLGQWSRLWGACLKANVSGGDAPGESSAASAILRSSKPSSTTAARTASRAASSSDE